MPTLDFKGKPFVYSHHLSVPFRELVVDAKKSLVPKGEEPSLDDNLIIHGDNLEALKALLPRYAGKVDVIYIDPPYNTGNEGWAYNDNVNSPLMKEWLGKNVDKEDLERHDKWLCMMWPRLQLLKELLKPSGFMFVHIDDIEASRLRCVIDEIFGELGFVAQLVWKSRKFPDARALTGISNDHEYILVYSQERDGEFRGVERDDTKFANPDKDPRGEWMSRSMLGLANAEARPNLHFSITDPKTGNNFDPPAESGWRYNRARMEKMISEGCVLFPTSADGRPREKKFKKDLTRPFSTFPSIIDDIHTSDGTAEISDILPDSDFKFPKPSALAARLLSQVGDENALVLDSFAGSGSTAHAVLSLNNADGGDRRFILVEVESYANTLTAERVRNVSKGVKAAKDEILKKGLGGTFTYCTLGDPIDLERFFDGKSSPEWEQVARYVAYTATGQTLAKAPKKPGKDWFVGEAGGYRIHLIYEPDVEFMRSNKAALDMGTAERISKCAEGKPVLVYAAAKFMGQKDLSSRGITFCQLPYAIHRILGDGPNEA